jgi:hypothetical protein
MADKQRRQTHQIATVNPKDRVNFDVLSATRFTLHASRFNKRLTGRMQKKSIRLAPDGFFSDNAWSQRYLDCRVAALP